MKRLLFATMLWAGVLSASAQPLERVSPESVGLDAHQLCYADSAIMRSMDAGEIPGAVLAVVRHGKMGYIKAYGNRRTVPKSEPMTENTIFDIASCTKPVATATSVMILAERGMLRLIDPVSDYIPEFGDYCDSLGRSTPIRIIDLMTHTSGLPAYVGIARLRRDYGEASSESLLQYICTCTRDFAPQSGFRYSCLNYITLQRIVEQVSGLSLRDFARNNIFEPLGMEHTDYIPCARDRKGHWYAADDPRWAVKRRNRTADIAPTERMADGTVLCGVVHDPLAREAAGGISGNAGLFSTADDLARFCAMMLGGGTLDGIRILSPAAVGVMERVPRETAEIGRTLGWDLFTAYASNKGDLFGGQAFGHTGFTGTSIVIDPATDTAIILLTNAVHPTGSGNVVRLRSLVSNVVAASIMNE